jgi:hypothetical protein
MNLDLICRRAETPAIFVRMRQEAVWTTTPGAVVLFNCSIDQNKQQVFWGPQAGSFQLFLSL